MAGQQTQVSFTVPQTLPLGDGAKYGLLKPRNIGCSLQDSTTYLMILAMFLSIVWSLVHFPEPAKKDWFGAFVTGLLSVLILLTVIIFGYAWFSSDASLGNKLIDVRSAQLLVVLAACAMGIVNANTARAKTGDVVGISTIILSTLAAVFCRSLYYCKIS